MAKPLLSDLRDSSQIWVVGSAAANGAVLRNNATTRHTAIECKLQEMKVFIEHSGTAKQESMLKQQFRGMKLAATILPSEPVKPVRPAHAGVRAFAFSTATPEQGSCI